MLTDTQKGPGLIQNLVRDLKGVTLTIRNPAVCVNLGEPQLLLADVAASDPPPVTIRVRDGAVIACDDQAIAEILSNQSIKVCDGELVESTDDDLVQEIIDAYTIEHARQWKADQIALHSKAMQDGFVQLYSVGEMTSWLMKRTESFAFAESGDPDDAPHLAHEASVRGISLESLCAKVDANAEMFAMLQATISGVEGRHRDAVATLNTFADVAAYDYFSDWPSVN